MNRPVVELAIFRSRVDKSIVYLFVSLSVYLSLVLALSPRTLVFALVLDLVNITAKTVQQPYSSRGIWAGIRQ